eukprot:4847311-Pleurochrysis_carterae.AAC.3
MHIRWQCLNLRGQRRPLPTQLEKEWSRRTHPGLGSGRGSLDIHDIAAFNFFRLRPRSINILIQT